MVFGADQVSVGRPKGHQNAETREFKAAVNALLEYAAPNMVEWLDKIAQDNPSKALDHIAGFAEYLYPKLSRTENTNRNIGIVQLVLGAAKMIEAEKLGSEALLIQPEPKKIGADDELEKLGRVIAEGDKKP